MNASFFARFVPAVVALCLPLGAAAQGLVRGPELPVPRVKADPPDVQAVRLPTGQMMKRLPGDTGVTMPLAAVTATTAAPVAGVSVQQLGNAQVRVLNSSAGLPAEPAALAARTADVSVRQVGQAQVLEVRGERAPALPGTAASAALPAGVVIVDLAPGQAPPWPPAANTLYRRTAASGG